MGCRSCGRPAGFLSLKRPADAESLKGAQQVEAVVLGFGFRMNHLRQLRGERHFAANRPQVVCVLGALNRVGKTEQEKRGETNRKMTERRI